jgi:hypothetical protein
MPVKTLAHTVPSVTGLISVTVTESYDAALSQAVIECYTTTLSLGDAISFNLGFAGDTGKVFTGFVRNIQQDLPGATTTIICEDVMSKAVDFFIAADDPQNPFQRFNIETGDLVEDVLNLADITSFSKSLPFTVTWATGIVPVEFNLVSAFDAAKGIMDVPAFHMYADRNGVVNLVSRRPYDEGGDSASFTWSSASDDLLSIAYEKSADNLRNRVVVYGITDVTASASAGSPHLPVGFTKTAVIATPIITSNSIAQTAADRNLAGLNRLTEGLNIQIEGNHAVQPRLFATVTDTYLGISGLWFIYRVEHRFSSQNGYIQNITLTR